MSNASNKPSTVWLKGEGIVKEANAGGAITPGHLVLRNSSNLYTVAGSAYEGLVAVALEQETVGKDIDSAYASGERVSAAYAQPGDEFQGLLAANATAVVVGSLLMAGAGGTVALRTASNKIIGQALEAIDNSANGSAVRLRWEAI